MRLKTKFLTKFIEYIKKTQLDKDLFAVPVIKMTGYFLDYGIKMKEMVMFLPGYTLYGGLRVLARELIEQEVFPKDQIDPLLLATHSGDTEMMKLLLSHGAKVSGDTIYVAMHTKRKNESENVLDTIVDFKGIDINDKGNSVNGNYPLIVAASKGFVSAVKCLLEHGADTKVKNDKKLTALHRAVIHKHTDIIQLLIDHKAPVNEKGGKLKRSPLHIAADLGMTEVVETFLKCKDVNIRIKDHCGHFPIFLAAIRGHCETVRVLLNHDKTQDSLRIASYGKKSFIKGMSLFHVAVWKNNRKLIQMLIDERANPNVKDFFGRTPLFFAIMTNKKTATRMLLQYSDKAIAEKQGYTPLHAAIHKGNIKVVAKLVAEVNVNAVDHFGRTPLHVACEKADVDTALMLLNQCDADPFMVTKRGDTVFHILRRKHGNQSHQEHLRRRLIEKLLLEKDPTIFERVKNMPNKRNVFITDIATLQETDERDIKLLRQSITTVFGAINDDDDNDDYDNNGAGISAKSSKTVLHRHAKRRSIDDDDDDDDDVDLDEEDDYDIFDHYEGDFSFGDDEDDDVDFDDDDNDDDDNFDIDEDDFPDDDDDGDDDEDDDEYDDDYYY
ncbi:ankyrin-1-like [Mya arenaria]|uniref:ankyrin-1-like n=1 Tax=Mya arenaria TaxID=6604 RepID=UPI0022E2809C|nr:ankyrin-1-like [Mya arenaria]